MLRAQIAFRLLVLLFTALVLSVASPSVRADDQKPGGSEVLILLHPNSSLLPETFPLYGPDGLFAVRRRPIGRQVLLTAALGRAEPSVRRATSITNLRFDDTFIVAMHPTLIDARPRIVPGLREERTGLPQVVDDIRVLAVQPYSVWYCKDSNTPPEKIGESFLFGSDSRLKQTSQNSSRYQDLDARTLSRRAIEKKLSDFPKDLACNALIPRIVDGQWFRRDDIDSLRRKIAGVMPADPSGRRGIDTDVRFHSPPARARRDANFVFEVRLWNRLPIRARGSISPVLPSGLGPAIPVGDGRTRFDLAPGQRSSLTFGVSFALHGALQEFDGIRYHLRNLSLGEETEAHDADKDGLRINPFTGEAVRHRGD